MSASIPIEPQGKAKRNTQAIASLILGVLSFIIMPCISCVPIIGALLAIVAGVRGFRASRQLEGRGRVLAMAGIGIGCLALLAAIAQSTINFMEPLQQMQQAISQATAAATSKTYQGDNFTVTYPGHWQTLDISQQESCKQTGVECLLAIGHPSGDRTNVNLMRFTLPQKTTVEQYDQEQWTQFESATSGVTLESREAIEVGGQPAVRRIFSAPSSLGSGGQAYILQVYVVKELSLFQFTGWAPNADALKQHRTEIEEIIASTEFLP